jgi:hypothetical protein
MGAACREADRRKKWRREGKMAAACAGPCLEHCYRCSHTTTLLARAALVYAIASAVYIAVSAACLATPFRDGLSSSQERVLAESSRARAGVFLAGLIAGTAAVAVWRPFGGPPAGGGAAAWAKKLSFQEEHGRTGAAAR